jgi:hypothetical protein
MAVLRLFVRGGARYAGSAPRLFAAAGEKREVLRSDLALQTAEDVAGTLGAMKGVLMKVGQMASYVDDGLSPAVRRTLARLQDSVPPMSPELAAAVVEEELGAPPERAFARWDPRPIAAASIGQVHRAITLNGQAIVGHLAVFYDTIREPGPLTITGDYASSVVRRFFDVRSPVMSFISVPRSYVILQRINLGLFAILGELSATANWRAITEEIWPFVQGPAATPMGQAEAAWRARRQAIAA